MAIEIIDRSTPNDNLGDSLYVATGKINDNFAARSSSLVLDDPDTFATAQAAKLLNDNKAELSGANFTGNVTQTTSGFKISLIGNNIKFDRNGPNYISAETLAGYLIFRVNGSTDPAFTINANSYVDAPGIYAETTASAANVFVDTDGSLRRSTSSPRYKKILEPIKPEFSKKIYQIAKEAAIFYKSLCDGDNKDWTHYGLDADKVAKIMPQLAHFGYFPEDYEIVEVPTIVEVEEINKKTGEKKLVKKEQIEKRNELKKGTEMSPVGVQYDRFVPLMLVEMDRLNKENEDLKKRIEKLEKYLGL